MIATYNRNRPQAPMTQDTIRRAAPSVFADRPWGKMSARYKFVPTHEVLAMLADQGYSPMDALQSRSRIEGKGEFTRHMIRLRHREFTESTLVNVGDEMPELVLTNSHDGTSAYKLMIGVFRLVCANGLIVQKGEAGGVSLKHSGGNDFHKQLIDVTYEVMDTAPATMNTVRTWKQIEATAPERQLYAESAAILRGGNIEIPADRMLATRRVADRQADVFTTMNVVQENLIRGGVRGTSAETGRRSTTRAVNSVGENLRLNQALWHLTEGFARMKGA